MSQAWIGAVALVRPSFSMERDREFLPLHKQSAELGTRSPDTDKILIDDASSGYRKVWHGSAGQYAWIEWIDESWSGPDGEIAHRDTIVHYGSAVLVDVTLPSDPAIPTGRGCIRYQLGLAPPNSLTVQRHAHYRHGCFSINYDDVLEGQERAEYEQGQLTRIIMNLAEYNTDMVERLQENLLSLQHPLLREAMCRDADLIAEKLGRPRAAAWIARDLALEYTRLHGDTKNFSAAWDATMRGESAEPPVAVEIGPDGSIAINDTPARFGQPTMYNERLYLVKQEGNTVRVEQKHPVSLATKVIEVPRQVDIEEIHRLALSASEWQQLPVCCPASFLDDCAATGMCHST